MQDQKMKDQMKEPQTVGLESIEANFMTGK